MHLANDPNPAPTPDYLWRVLREYIVNLHALFGAPLDLARKVWVHRDEARFISDALRPLEMMLRRLIFLRALEAPAPEIVTPPPTPPRPRTRRDAYNLESSTSWHASFDLGARGRYGPLASPPACLRQSQPNAGETPAVHIARVRLPNAEFTRNVALRYEALIRGFNDPDRLVARMARLLARDRGRQYKWLAPVRKRDAAKPCFHEAALTITLAWEHFHAWVMRQLPTPRAADSS